MLSVFCSVVGNKRVTDDTKSGRGLGCVTNQSCTALRHPMKLIPRLVYTHIHIQIYNEQRTVYSSAHTSNNDDAELQTPT